MANTPLDKFQRYVEKLKEIHDSSVVVDVDEDYEIRINKSLSSLQAQVKQHEDALEELRAKSQGPSFTEPSLDPNERLKQLHRITAAYRSLTLTEPILPLPNSPLPALLALRNTLNTIEQTKASVKETHENITKACGRLREEEDQLRDAREQTQALERKIEKTRSEYEESLRKTSQERAEIMIQQQQQRERFYLADMKKLVNAFNTFTNEHLAVMIAAEDLGGPVVGDLLNIDEETLKAGFTSQGNPRKIKGGRVDKSARDRRNKEIWDLEDSESDIDSKSEIGAAGAEFRALAEDLLNAAAGDEDAGPYIDIERESASVRFLVRANVAQFHPEDARQLRLIDFGKELDD